MEWCVMIDSWDEEKCEIMIFDNLDRVGMILFCGVIKEYVEGNKEFEKEFNDFLFDGFWVKYLFKNKNEVMFVV